MDDCIFCSIVSGQAPSDVVFEDDETVFFRDISPQAPVHVVGITKKHIDSLASLTSDDQAVVGKLVLNISVVARQLGVDESGYRVILNVGSDAAPEVMHMHWHILGGEPLGPLLCKK